MGAWPKVLIAREEPVHVPEEHEQEIVMKDFDILVDKKTDILPVEQNELTRLQVKKATTIYKKRRDIVTECLISLVGVIGKQLIGHYSLIKIPMTYPQTFR
ncbi:hypothetical protein CHS0354_010412 [Potamilus streckersoni]|uniref:Uncharacterized protein n=1 Tax=Potamilus streckersoni TaxID=2493646 RepID=A0AAE0RQU2_9BIVA|nr:hypothetical protein CHS0354_010412 [Potamilus streckersoni]